MDAPTGAASLVACPSCRVRFLPPGATVATVILGEAAGDWKLEDVPLDHAFRARWELAGVLGHGAWGTVYRAVDRKRGGAVAIKFLRRVDPPEALGRFVREGELAARVDDPHVVRVLATGTQGSSPYIVSELVEGGTLRARLEKAGRLPVSEAVRVACDVLHGLEACHAAGIVHRDVKPENVLLDGEGRARLADLGIARDTCATETMTAAGVVLGTPRYMAPEQARGEAVTARSDVYAAAVVLYELIAGQPPYTGENAYQVIERHMIAPVPDLAKVADAPGALARVVTRALAKDPAQRQAGAAVLAGELAASLAPRAARSAEARTAPPVVKRPQVAARPTVEPIEAEGGSWGRVTLGVIVLLVGGGLWALVRPTREDAPPRRPEAIRLARDIMDHVLAKVPSEGILTRAAETLAPAAGGVAQAGFADASHERMLSDEGPAGRFVLPGDAAPARVRAKGLSGRYYVYVFAGAYPMRAEGAEARDVSSRLSFLYYPSPRLVAPSSRQEGRAWARDAILGQARRDDGTELLPYRQKPQRTSGLRGQDIDPALPYDPSKRLPDNESEHGWPRPPAPIRAIPLDEDPDHRALFARTVHHVLTNTDGHRLTFGYRPEVLDLRQWRYGDRHLMKVVVGVRWFEDGTPREPGEKGDGAQEFWLASLKSAVVRVVPDRRDGLSPADVQAEYVTLAASNHFNAKFAELPSELYTAYAYAHGVNPHFDPSRDVRFGPDGKLRGDGWLQMGPAFYTGALPPAALGADGRLDFARALERPDIYRNGVLRYPAEGSSARGEMELLLSHYVLDLATDYPRPDRGVIRFGVEPHRELARMGAASDEAARASPPSSGWRDPFTASYRVDRVRLVPVEGGWPWRRYTRDRYKLSIVTEVDPGVVASPLTRSGPPRRFPKRKPVKYKTTLVGEATRAQR